MRKVSPLLRKLEVAELRDGTSSGLSTKVPAKVSFDPLTIERGLTADESLRIAAGATSSNAKLERGEGVVEVLDESGEAVVTCLLKEAWISEYQIFSELSADAKELAIEKIVVQFDDWLITVRGP